MSSVEEHFAKLKAMNPRQGGWLTDRFHQSAAIFLGAHLEELEAAWLAAQSSEEQSVSPNEVSAGNSGLDAKSLLPPSTLVRELVGALEGLTEEVCDYATINHLGDPELKHNIKRARSALLRAREEMEGLQTNGEKPSADAQERRSGGEL